MVDKIGKDAAIPVMKIQGISDVPESREDFHKDSI